MATTASKKHPLMTAAEHTAVYQAIAESTIVVPVPGTDRGLDRRVQTGAEFLDTHHPGWADKINLDRFDLRSGTQCVIGQLYGTYTLNAHRVFDEALGTTLASDYDDEDVTVEESSHGFCLKHDWDADDATKEGVRADWERLDTDWQVAIRARQTI